MIPQINSNLISAEESIFGSKTYQVDFENNEILGMIDGLESVNQSLIKMLKTERFSHSIYAAYYGAEFEKFIGKDRDYAKMDIGRVIEETLITDDRVKSVDSINITEEQDDLLIFIEVTTIFGGINLVNTINI